MKCYLPVAGGFTTAGRGKLVTNTALATSKHLHCVEIYNLSEPISPWTQTTTLGQDLVSYFRFFLPPSLLLSHCPYILPLYFSSLAIRKSHTLNKMSGHTRRASYSKTCSATGPNAKAGEDWRMMQDLSERRRVQNRLAQRGYRESLLLYFPVLDSCTV